MIPKCPAGIKIRYGGEEIYKHLRLPMINFNIADVRFFI